MSLGAVVKGLVLLAAVEGIAGARLLQQTGSVSAVVGGSPGSTGQVNVGFSGPQGVFSQTIPLAGSGALQFSTNNGGTLRVQGPGGQIQTFSSVLGPPGTTLPPLPTFQPIAPIAPIAPIPPVPPISAVPSVPKVPGTFPTINLSGFSTDFAAQARARISEFFRQISRSASLQQGAAGGSVGNIVLPQPSLATTVGPTGGSLVGAVGIGPTSTVSLSTPTSQRVSASVTGPGSTSLALRSSNVSG